MVFELYIQQQNFTVELWKNLVKTISHHLHAFQAAEITIYFGPDHMVFFVEAPQDFSILSREFAPFILKKETLPFSRLSKAKRIRLSVKSHEDLVDLGERQRFKKHRNLERVSISIHKRLGWFSFKTRLFFRDTQAQLLVARKSSWHFPYQLLAVDFSHVINYKKKSLPLYVKLDKVRHLLTKTPSQGFLEVQGFPYLNTPEYVSITEFDFSRHSLIVGQTGTGKSKFIELFVKQLYKHNLQDQYTVVVLDPHASLYADFLSFKDSTNINFRTSACQLFAQLGEPKVAVELTILLFETLMKDQFNPQMERVLKYCLFVLFTTNQMSLEALHVMLTDVSRRKELLAMPGLSDSVIQFFDTDFVELETRHYQVAIMPILTLLDELNFLPISNFQESEPLAEILQANSLVFLSLDKILLGDKATKLVAGLLIQQLFLLAQSRVIGKKLIFIVDEVSVVQNKALSSILSEARKFDLSLFLTQQYLGQVEDDLLKSIIANVYNYFIFKVSEDDAKRLVNNLEFEFAADQLAAAKEEKGLSEEALRTRMITTLNPRECMVRVYRGDRFYPVFKAKTMNI